MPCNIGRLGKAWAKGLGYGDGGRTIGIVGGSAEGQSRKALGCVMSPPREDVMFFTPKGGGFWGLTAWDV